jgi:glucokinase
MMNNGLLLAGDIGGTKTTLALYKQSSSPGKPIHEASFKNNQAKNLTELITTFLHDDKEKPAVACFGVAGPVRDGWVRMTNLKWCIDAHELSQSLDFKHVFIVNDLVATAMGATLLPKNELVTINAGKEGQRGNIAVLAPGTGLGEAFLLQENKQSIPVASEGGHADFAPRNRKQLELLDFLLDREKHVSVEKVCSGLGIPNLYDFLTTSLEHPADLEQKLAAVKDRTPIIVNTALEARKAGNMSHICVQTLQLFVDILAAEAANLALKVLATEGIFIGGGIPPRILPFFKPDQFMAVFSRGVYSEMLSEIPIHVILNPKTALLGAAAYGMMQTKNTDKQ